jgi:hypothetical protein
MLAQLQAGANIKVSEGTRQESGPGDID